MTTPVKQSPTDRSRIETAENCKRKRYLGYHYMGGLGLERNSLSIDLEVGKATHAILDNVLWMLQRRTFSDEALNTIISANLVTFEHDIRARGIAIELATGYEQAEDGSIAVAAPLIDFFVNLYRVWITNAVTAWCAIRGPEFVNTYDVLETEQEQELVLGDGQLLFLSRPDAVLRRRSDGELFILNFKTVGDANQWWREQWAVDMQTLSEVLPIEAKLGQRVSGVLIEGIVKGPKKVEYPRDSGQWWSSSPFCWCWIKPAAPPFPPELAARYEWHDPDTGQTRRLGKGYSRKPIWEVGTTDGWLKWLIANEPELVASQFVQLPPILRSDRDCERWVRQVTASELDIADRLEQLNGIGDPTVVDDAQLDKLFPMNTSGGNCLRPSRCPFFDMCWGIAGMDPLNMGFRLRIPNHPKELAVLQGGANATSSV